MYHSKKAVNFKKAGAFLKVSQPQKSRLVFIFVFVFVFS